MDKWPQVFDHLQNNMAFLQSNTISSLKRAKYFHKCSGMTNFVWKIADG